MKRIILLLIFVLQSINTYAYDNEYVHQLINESAAMQSVNFIVTMNQLGFKGALPSEIIELNIANSRTIKYWLREGGKQEDVPICQSKYHFHDPTKPFDSAGLSNGFIDLACVNWGHRSSLLWAQDQSNQWSWQRGREYYYQALTAVDKNIRELKFADTFRAVGQVMHLLADASVPEHTRNDIHIFPWFDNATQSFPQIGSWTYETWCKWHAPDLNTNVTAQDYGITNTSVVPGLIPIFNFWDTTPTPIIGSFIPVGLAEYSNYNFLSRDTIFKDYTYPVNPVTMSGYLQVVTAKDGKKDKRIYFSGVTSDNKPIEHLVSTGYLWAELNNISPFSMDAAKFNLDDSCFQDYASILVPKAVTYSAALLDYFFRGSIGISGPSSGYYAMAKAPAGGFKNVKLRAINTTPNGEAMQDGSISLVVKYQATEDTEFVYQVASESNGIRSIPTDQPVELTFNLSSEVPVTATDVYLQLVYHGKLGGEDGAVAVGFKDISEPTPIDIYNNMDKICLYSAWYDAGSQAAISAASNATDIYPHEMQELYIKISTLSNPKWAKPEDHDIEVKNFLPGTLQRTGYILTDVDPITSDFVYGLYTVPGTLDASDNWMHDGVATLFEGIAWQNQVEYDPIRCGSEVPCRLTLDPGFYTFRGVEMWWGAGFIYSNVAYPSKTCSIDLLNGIGP